MKKKSFLKIGGAMLLLAIVLNIQYAWSGYGVKDHPLYLEVLGQSNDTGTSGDIETHPLWSRLASSCTMDVEGEPGSEVSVFGIKVKIRADGIAPIIVSDASVKCQRGGNAQCTPFFCADFWKQMTEMYGTPATQ